MKVLVKNRFVRWLLAVIVITGLLIGANLLHNIRAHEHRFTGVYNIHFINYRGRSDVDVGFEHFLKQNGVKYKITYHDFALDPGNASKIKEKIKKDRDIDLIVTWGTTTTIAIAGKYDAAETDIIRNSPVIFTVVADPVRAGVVSPNLLRRSGVTGATHIAPLYNQFRTMMAHHQTKKICMVYTPTELNSINVLEDMTLYAHVHGVEMFSVAFSRDQNGLPSAINADDMVSRLAKEDCEWVYLPPDAFLGSNAKRIISASHRHGIRTFASTEILMKSGAAYGLYASYFDVGQLAGEQAKQILVDGAKPESIPIDRMQKFNHYVNADALLALGLNIEHGNEHDKHVTFISNKMIGLDENEGQ